MICYKCGGDTINAAIDDLVWECSFCDGSEDSEEEGME